MSLEERIDKLIGAVETLTATLKSGASATATASNGAGGSTTTTAASGGGETRGRGRPPKDKGSAAPASKYTAEQVKDLMVRVKNEVSTDAAKEVISEAGADKLATLLTKPELWDRAMELGTAALAPPDDGEDGTDGEDPDEI